MSYLPFVSRYDKEPETKIEGYEAWAGYDAICSELQQAMVGKRTARITSTKTNDLSLLSIGFLSM